MPTKLTQVASPHLFTQTRTSTIMKTVCLALLPAICASIFFFGLAAVKIYVASILTCFGTEFIWRKWRKRETLADSSWLVTALLLAMSLPVSVPFWYPIIGGVIAIIGAKELFGGLGKNFLNPALAGRAVLRLIFAKEMSENVQPQLPFGLPQVDVVSSATPLMIVEKGDSLDLSQLLESIVGFVAGKNAETSALLLLAGGIFLLVKKVITWQIPVSMLATISVTALFTSHGELTQVAGHLLGGATLLGAFFMATDYCSSPSTSTGEIIFGIGCGVVVMAFRLFSSMPEGMTFAILLMNCTTPLLDRWLIPRVFGEKA